MVLKVLSNLSDSIIPCSFRGTFLGVRRLWEVTQQCFLQHNLSIEKYSFLEHSLDVVMEAYDVYSPTHVPPAF